MTDKIKVQYDNGQIVDGKVTNFLGDFAKIVTAFGSFEASWETVKRCQESGKPIRY